MRSPEVTLYHGTSTDTVGKEVLSGKIPLLGMRILNDPGWSGSLTDDYSFARRWAWRRGDHPIVITYSLPYEIVIDEGIIGLKQRERGYSTNLEVEPRELPLAYIRSLRKFKLLEPSVLKAIFEKGEISFHAVPYAYLKNFENV